MIRLLTTELYAYTNNIWLSSHIVTIDEELH